MVDMSLGGEQEGHGDGFPLRWDGEHHWLGSHRLMSLWKGISKVIVGHPTCKE